MSGPAEQADLERRYRRLLAWYPRPFRRENEEEILTVLLAGATESQRPGLAESADLVKSALWMRVRPSVPRSARTLRAAARLMCTGAVLELAALVTVVVTAGSVSSVVARHEPAQLPAVHAQLAATEIAAAIAVGVWLWLAWANGQGQGWARAAFLMFAGLSTVNLIGSLAQDGATYAPADLTAGAVLWLLELVAAVLILTPRATRCYQHKPAQR